MTLTQDKVSKELEELIVKAVRKVNGDKENDICRYLPVSTGGYIHHFTMRKMKHEDPVQLSSMISKYIINSDAPTTVKPKQRAARGSRKRRDQFMFTKHDIERMLQMARLANDKEMIRKLTPKKDLKALKKELISSIRRGEMDQDLWESYCDIMRADSGEVATPEEASAVNA